MDGKLPDQKVRGVGCVIPSHDTDKCIFVDHVYLAGITDEDGYPDEGSVGIKIADGDSIGVGTLLTASEALVLADRLQRAAQLVLETEEDVPDSNREYQRWSRPQPPSDD